MEFITDRNLLDVNIAKNLLAKIKTEGYASLTSEEQTLYASPLKGTLNYTDLNRIESNCSEFSTTFNLSLTTKTDWDMNDLPTLSDFQRIRNNIESIRAVGYIYSDTPATPTLPINRYDKLNDIELILEDVYYLYETNSKEVYYSGELYDYQDYNYYKSLQHFPYLGEIWADEEIGVL